MKKVVILGCGFGGLSAAIELSKNKNISVSVIDKSENFTLIPVLPDIIGREINPQNVVFPIGKLSKKYNFDFINSLAKNINIQNNNVLTEKEIVKYDYLIIAVGAETNFYGDRGVESKALKLDNAEDSKKIHDTVMNCSYQHFVVSGGGYTGIEVATNIKLLLDKKKMNKKVTIVEASPSLLGAIPKWMKEYIIKNLKKMKVEFKIETSVKAVEGKTITLSTGEKIESAILIWSAGVKTPDVVYNLDNKKTKQGRIIVDEYLKIKDNCFIIGDSASFDKLRMAVRFSIQQGRLAAKNIINLIKGKKLQKYKPFDLGYLLPMANNACCGIILGMPVKGFLAIWAHYFLSVWLSYGKNNKLGIIKDLLYNRSIF